MDKYQITFNTWNSIADLYQKLFMDLDLYDDTYLRFCQLVEKPNATILEIGCGPGNITKFLVKQRADFQILGIDVAPNMINLAKKNNPSATFQAMDCRELDTLTSTFDAIMCGFCIPYLTQKDVAKLIKDSSKLLHPNGILYLSTIEGDYQQSGFESGSSGDQTYVYYHQANDLRKILEDHNFTVIELIKKDYTTSRDEHQKHIILITRK